MMRLLVSVRDLAEAEMAARANVDFIDLKDPAAGALGALPLGLSRRIVQALRARPPAADGAPPTVISATIGDLSSSALRSVLAMVDAVADTGVDHVKVGIDGGPGAAALLEALAGSHASVVPVLLADQGIDMALVQQALALDHFPALMVDTAGKRSGSLLDRLPYLELVRFISAVRHRPGRAPCLVGLAGALRTAEMPELKALRPDFAGFRSAVCSGDRAGAMDLARLQALKAAALPLPG